LIFSSTFVELKSKGGGIVSVYPPVRASLTGGYSYLAPFWGKEFKYITIK